MLLRVASFNVHHGVGADGVLDLDRTAETLRATGAEVIGLQEVDQHLSSRSDRRDQPAVLADLLGMDVAFGPTIDLVPRRPGGPRRRYGNALLTAHPIVAWHNVALPTAVGDEPRALLVAHLAVDGTDVTVACTHLQNRAPAQRRVQAERIVDLLGLPAPPRPTVLVGDMNATPGTPELATLTARLVDAWAAAGQGDGRTFDATTPHARIDYVLATPDLVPRAAWVLPTDASDHRPVAAELARETAVRAHRPAH